MHQIVFLVTTALVVVSEAKSVTSLKGPPCPEGDGLYAVGCSSKYLQCVNNVESEHSCPEGFYFDRLMSRCERRAENYLCKKINMKNLNVRQKAIENNTLIIFRCPQHQVYIPTIEKCDYVENCKSSGVNNYVSPIPSTTPSQADTEEPIIIASYPAITDAPVTSGYTQSVHKTTLPSQNYSAFCERLADGNYGLDCENYYFECFNSETFKQYCPAELVYSLLTDQCDYKVNVEGCPEFVKPTPFTFPSWSEPKIVEYESGKHLNIDHITITPRPVDTASVSKDFACYQRPDGLYGLPYCSNYFIQCLHGLFYFTPCRDGLFYNEWAGYCDEKKNIPICNDSDKSGSINSNSCIGKTDGYYSAGCSPHYFGCYNEAMYRLKCPAFLKFEENEGCKYATSVAACDMPKNPDETPPQLPKDFCTTRSDGLHAVRICSRHYVICDNGKSIRTIAKTAFTIQLTDNIAKTLVKLRRFTSFE
ncbi:hypothetical protein CAEBREN_17259 [Caenorhabditis brenneri]|uniref:Chitin-binding type-2 domain-containing protein n=1 Tax=Caenorhabditis brenneri TaxID=135651 RepID=G0MWE0_CAEBE|nr:hypothetical protein CAEBREN_17259 [Caenorhabditis brenneri]